MPDCSCYIDQDCEDTGNYSYEGDSKAVPAAGIKCECCGKVFNGKEQAQEYFTEADEDCKPTEDSDFFYVCPDCQAVIKTLFCGDYIFENVWSSLSEEFGEQIAYELRNYDKHEEGIPWGKIATLPEGAKNKVLAMIEEIYKEEEDNRKALAMERS